MQANPKNNATCQPERAAFRARCLGVVVLFATCTFAQVQTAVPLDPKPVFTPGMYETESRNSAFSETNR